VSARKELTEENEEENKLLNVGFGLDSYPFWLSESG